jgi:hypothetical protein
LGSFIDINLRFYRFMELIDFCQIWVSIQVRSS